MTDCGLLLAVFEPLFKGQSTIKCGGSGRRDRQTCIDCLLHKTRQKVHG